MRTKRINNPTRITVYINIMAFFIVPPFIATFTICLYVSVYAMREDLNDITDRVDEIERRPSKRWETVITALITAVVGAVVGYLFRGC